MKDPAKSATILVMSHLGLLLSHGAAHSHLKIGTNVWQSGFIAVAIFVCPLVGMGLIWARRTGPGLILLGLSFASSFIFGVYYHFMLSGPDNIFSAGHMGWGLCFRVTAVALALLELLGCVWSLRLVLALSRRSRVLDAAAL